jgi:hypothetical protein
LIYLLQPSPNEIFVLACIHRAQSNNKKNQWVSATVKWWIEKQYLMSIINRPN